MSMLQDVGVIATPWKPANAFVYGVLLITIRCMCMVRWCGKITSSCHCWLGPSFCARGVGVIPFPEPCGGGQICS